MDASTIGLIGIIIGVVLTSSFQLISKYIDYRIGTKNRWVEEKKQAYAKFLMSSNTWFRHSLAVSIHTTSQEYKKKHKSTINDSRIELNTVLAMINIIGGPKVVAEAEEFNDWMQSTTRAANQDGLSKEESSERINAYVEKRAKLTSFFRQDF